MIAAVLFDFGGTLDGDGLHWLDRFYDIYSSQPALDLPRERIKDAFYYADAQLEADATIAACGFREMMRRHCDHQLARLGIADARLRDALASGFADPAIEALKRNRGVMEELHRAGLRMGVVSNFYGNVDALCREAGMGPYLDVVLDSSVVGLSKPDPRLYQLAAERLGLPPEQIVMVGDNFDRDVRPARAVGMRAYWLAPGREHLCPEPALVDGILARVTELPARLRAQGAMA